MDYFEVTKKDKKINSINRTIRMEPDQFDKLMELSEKHGVSFNKVVNQCIEFALSHMKKTEE